MTASTTSATTTPSASVRLAWTVVLVKIVPPRCTSRSLLPGRLRAASSISATVASSSWSRGTSSWTWESASPAVLGEGGAAC